uniref:NEDD8-specific protease 1 n=1 Tax=Anthurium amnicola TaxID=1678845 RepID=A0A1D1Z0K7_9ARAE
MVRPKGDDKILCFRDVVLRRSDLDILRGPHYINDRIIEFFFSDLSSSVSLDDILLVPPSISFWIANCSDFEGLEDVVEPLKLSEKKVVVFTVNDNDDVTVAEGGLHWSLLAYDREKNVFIHHDSMAGLNRLYADRLYKRVRRFLGDLGSSAGFVEGFTPRQENGYDCGLFVMLIAKLIVRWHVQRTDLDNQWFPLVKDEVNAASIGCMRKQILSRIEQLMDEDRTVTKQPKETKNGNGSLSIHTDHPSARAL